MSSKTAKIKASSIQIGWIAEELGDVAMDIRNGNTARVLNIDKFKNMVKTLMDVKKRLNDICEEDDTNPSAGTFLDWTFSYGDHSDTNFDISCTDNVHDY